MTENHANYKNQFIATPKLNWIYLSTKQRRTITDTDFYMSHVGIQRIFMPMNTANIFSQGTENIIFFNGQNNQWLFLK